ncbi:glycogen/starch/alpha-glucan phosphorylase [Oscillospiraceae bacterium MB08-C2-2]|nr:glycogen/starch/alpha-glucan phosphorylase [Oscillospiraceae bacterium MB08-C2-2]
MKHAYSTKEIQERIAAKLTGELGWDSPEAADDAAYYKAVALVVREITADRRRKFKSHSLAAEKKQVYYLSMEFLLGRSLKNSLFNLGLTELFAEALFGMQVRLERLYEYEPDAGLGNGGLGRLAACYMDAMATNDIMALGYCLRYDFGIFKQTIVEGWQNEEPDNWLPMGEVWMTPRPSHAVSVHFGGHIEESWDDNYHLVNHVGYTTVQAVPYDIRIPGYSSEGVSTLRLWRAKSPAAMDMESFNRGDYSSAFEQAAFGEAITKVLYPNDNHVEGKLLRLRQQYFLCAASISDICRRHLSVYGSFDNFADKNAIHINDTHPTLAIPELMRFLLDDCGYGWDAAWSVVSRTFAYTNHTVMQEAMEVWDEPLFKNLLPRIHTIIVEINRRFCAELSETYHLPQETVERMSIIGNRQIRMAHLAVAGSHSVNGVSKLHSQILQDAVFADFYKASPAKFTNVTNGIASRRWLIQSNPSLTNLIKESIGPDFAKDMSKLAKLRDFAEDKSFLKELARSKEQNKLALCEYVRQKQGIVLNPHSIFDTQAKRLHEYKRQQLNVLHIISQYLYLKENPGADFVPRTYFFAAKAAPGYFVAKQIINLICTLAEQIEKDAAIRDKLRVVFLENYSVTLSEILMPATEISQQISLAGTEASGTGNMKLMLNGAITLGTLDGANVEILEAVGEENMLLFGLKAAEAATLREAGYNPLDYYTSDPVLKSAVDYLLTGFDSDHFAGLHSLLTTSDYYMTMADFSAYREAQHKAAQLYSDPYHWQKMSLMNIAGSGIFSSDRAILEYARKIWKTQA